MQKHEELIKLLENMGASFAGFADVSGKTEGVLRNLHYAVSIGIHLSDAIIDEISDKPTYTYFHHYRTVNALLDQITLRGLLFIQQNGFNAVPVPASQTVNDKADPYCSIFPHKTAAVLAGMGRIGKNGLFIHENYGARVRLATILTDMELPCGELSRSTQEQLVAHAMACETAQTVQTVHTISKIHTPQGVQAVQTSQINKTLQLLQNGSCGNCYRCVEACPAMALTGREWTVGMAREELVDARACSDYMNKNFKHIGRGSVCGICMKVCPAYGKHNQS